MYRYTKKKSKWKKKTLGKTEGEIMNGQFRETGNIGYTRTKTNNAKLKRWATRIPQKKNGWTWLLAMDKQLQDRKALFIVFFLQCNLVNDEHKLYLTQVFTGVRVAQTFIVCPSNYRFWLLLWYLQTLLTVSFQKSHESDIFNEKNVQYTQCAQQFTLVLNVQYNSMYNVSSRNCVDHF